MGNNKNKNDIREIARQAGVSTATVSRVINSPELTAQQTREKVLEVIKKNNYVPNHIARQLILGKTNSIGFMVFDLNIPFYVSIIKHMNQLALEKNFNILICETEASLDREKKYFDFCLGFGASGIIFTEGWAEGWEDRLDLRLKTLNNIPIVLLDRKIENNKSYYIVKSDHKKEIKLLFDHIYNYGHRKIAFICGPSFMTTAIERHKSYLECLDTHGIPLQSQYIFDGDFTETSGLDAFEYFHSLPNPPTAVIASNDAMAKGFILKAMSYGVEIPKKYSVCGVDGVDELAFYPRLTTVKQNTKVLAEEMFNFIINADKIKPPKQAIIDVELCEGNTVCRCDDASR